MTDDSKIKKSIERNRKKRVDEPANHDARRATSFKMLCRLLNAPFTMTRLAIVMVITGLVVYKLSTGITDVTIESIGFGLLAMIVIAGGYALYLYSWYPDYVNFTQEKNHLLEEWVFFVNTRSEKFLADQLFVKVTVAIKPTALANAKQHEAIDEFLSRWQREGSDIYSGSKWSTTRPDSFTVDGRSISGHISISYGMKLLLKKMLTDIPKLAAQMGKEYFTTDFSWASEKNFDQEDSRDSIDEAKEEERHRQMMAKE
jgi:hypothetical protein